MVFKQTEVVLKAGTVFSVENSGTLVKMEPLAVDTDVTFVLNSPEMNVYELNGETIYVVPEEET